MRDSQRDCGMPALQNENEQSALSPAGLHVDAAHVQFTRGPSTRGVGALSESSARSTATWPLFNNEAGEIDSILGVVQLWLIALYGRVCARANPSCH